AEALLLIGDKVVTAAPSAAEYPYQMDLGEEWKGLTGLPFVFAMGMMRREEADAGLARLLAEARRRGGDMTEALVGRYAAEKGWPAELARRYFTEYLRYAVTERATAGLAAFFERAGPGGMGILPARRAVEYLAIG
ncbi:MAG: MqnA/MqnD/SBP family protein, partial [Phycisphaerae bacterium]